MDGDIVPLPEIVEVCQRHGARILIDEAHSAFIFGETGRGRGGALRPGGSGRHPPRDLFEEPGRDRRLRRRAAEALRLPPRVRAVPRVLVRDAAAGGGGPHEGAGNRPQ